MNGNQSSYRKVMKATSIFGGVQVILIIISIIRSKFIAILLGSAGLGILGLLTTSINLIGNLTNFGLATSAVRDVSSANSEADHNRVAIIIAVLNRCVWITGLLGTFVVLILSPWLSQFAFGNKDYIGSFVLISISLLFTQLNSGQLVVLQGLQKVKFLAKASLIGSVFGLIITVPIYYFLGINGVVPAFLIASLFSFLVSKFFVNKINLTFVKVSKEETIRKGKKMLEMGFMISMGILLASFSSYLIQIFISKKGGVEQVGLFTAGFAVINTYVGLVFTAMSTDYFPRLSSVSYSNELCKKSINQQAEVAVLILGPVLICFLVFIKWVIVFLYSIKFLAVEDMILWAALGVFFKAASWSIGYLILAKGNSKLFFWNELLSNVYVLGLNIFGYYFYGLEGIGISFLVGYFIHLLQLFFVCNLRYGFSFDICFIRIFSIQFLIALSCFIFVKFVGNPFSYYVGSVFILLSFWHSYKELDKRLDLRIFIKDKLSN
jgi:O-antigen/teichoic acid export membrane protein